MKEKKRLLNWRITVTKWITSCIFFTLLLLQKTKKSCPAVNDSWWGRLNFSPTPLSVGPAAVFHDQCTSDQIPLPSIWIVFCSFHPPFFLYCRRTYTSAKKMRLLSFVSFQFFIMTIDPCYWSWVRLDLKFSRLLLNHFCNLWSKNQVLV